MMSKRKHWPRLALILVVIFVMATTVWAGSNGVKFGWSFGSVPSTQESRAYKSDAGTSSGNHASVYIQGYSGTCKVDTAVYTVNNKRVTGNYRIEGRTSLDMPYTSAVTNGTLILRGVNQYGNGGMSGVWYP